MTLGTISPSIALHDPDRLHCGPQEPVEGHVSIKWIAKDQTAELFGPAQIYVTLEGRIKVTVGNTNQGRSVRIRVPLFATRKCIHDGPLRIQNQETQNFPYQVAFPADWRWEPDEKWKRLSMHKSFDASDKTYTIDPNQPLPPSMVMLDNGTKDDGEALIQYCVTVEAVMPSLDVSISSGNKSFIRKDVLYERPKMARTILPLLDPSPGKLIVRDRCLVPEAMRPNHQGFRQRASAVFRPGPKPLLWLDWDITAPKNVHRGQPYVVTIRCQPSAEKSTTVEVPELRLLSLRARAEARAIVRTQQDNWFSGSWSQYHTVSREAITPGSQVQVTDNGGPSTVAATDIEGAKLSGLPFEKGNNWTQTVLFETLTKDMCSSIKTMCIRRVYNVRIKCQISVAGKHEELSRAIDVEVHPPLADELNLLPPPAPEFGEAVTGEEALPAYEA